MSGAGIDELEFLVDVVCVSENTSRGLLRSLAFAVSLSLGGLAIQSLLSLQVTELLLLLSSGGPIGGPTIRRRLVEVAVERQVGELPEHRIGRRTPRVRRHKHLRQLKSERHLLLSFSV